MLTRARRLGRSSARRRRRRTAIATSAVSFANLPNAELILFPDSNHGSHLQYAELFNQYLSDFVDLGADPILVG
jgi:pimeloyl-ACP methyl ester carboxylesterase